MTWRTARPKFLCRRHGHVPYDEFATDVSGFLLCGCGKWYPMDNPLDAGSSHPMNHYRFNMWGLPAGMTPPPTAQPPLTYEVLQRMTTPFVHLRDNPEELAKMDFRDIRTLIIDRLADYEEGMDV